MQIKLKAKNLNLSDAQKEAIEAKILKLQHLADRLSDEATEFRVEVGYEQSRKANQSYVCQLTIFAPGTVIRAENRNESIENAIDDCMDKIKGQIERYKSKIHRDEKKISEPVPVQEAEKTEEFEIPKVLRRKRFTNAEPMSEEDAIEKMELVGHDFFLFNNQETGRFSVVYKRSDGYYGVIEPKGEND